MSRRLERIVGVDEAGRGPLCGPVIACAFCFNEKNKTLPVKDSKQLNPVQRQEFFDALLEKGTFSVGLATSGEIDKLNILEATMVAFNRALSLLISKDVSLKKATFIVDGNYFKTDLDITYKCVEKADEKVREVSSASIIAKVFRDYLMRVLDWMYPEWNFRQHKGYPTKFHRKLLKVMKPTPFHRKSFSFTHD